MDVLRALDPAQDEIREMIFVEAFGDKIRDIINTFPEKTGYDPDAQDIIWCLGCDLSRDPREIMSSLLHDTHCAN